MYRRYFASNPYRSNFCRSVFIGVGISALGTLYLSQRNIYADGSRRDRRSYKDEDESYIPVIIPRETQLGLWPEPGGSGNIDGDTGIRRFDYFSVPNAFPRNDAFVLASVRLSSGTSWTFFSLSDGHHGWENANRVAPLLFAALLESLTKLFSKYEPPAEEHTEIGVVPPTEPNLEPFSRAANRAIKETFINVDNEFVQKPFDFASHPHPKGVVVSALGAAVSGSSLLLSFYDSDSRALKVALTGNSRAVLGRRGRPANGHITTYEAHVLTTEHNCRNPTEQERLRSLHPGENPCVDGPLRGIGITRAFGLAAFKWSQEVQERLHRDYMGDVPLSNAITPPYLTAEPDITTIETQPGDFLVMASNGLWNSLTNEEVVGLVGMWLNRDMDNVETVSSASTIPKEPIEPRDLPVLLGTDDTVMYPRWRAKKRFLCIDNNAAGHLTRNALGGADEQLSASLLALRPPRAHKFRDDINVTVVFFDK